MNPAPSKNCWWQLGRQVWMIYQTSLQVSASLMWEALARQHMSLPRACSIAASSCSRHPGCAAAFMFGVGKWFSLVEQVPGLAFLRGLPLKQREPKHCLEFPLWQNNTSAFPFSSRITIFTRWKISHFQPTALAGTRKHKPQQKPVHSTLITAIEYLVAVAARNTNTVTPDHWTRRARGLTKPFYPSLPFSLFYFWMPQCRWNIISSDSSHRACLPHLQLSHWMRTTRVVWDLRIYRKTLLSMWHQEA